MYTAGCQTVSTTRFDNRLNEQWLFVQHGCQTGCQTGFDNLLDNRLDVCLHNTAVCQTGFDNRVEQTATVRSTGCQTALYNRFDNRLYRVNGASE